MNVNDQELKKFFELRSKLWAEYHEIERELEEQGRIMEELDTRWTELNNILDGSVTSMEQLRMSEEPEAPSEPEEELTDDEKFERLRDKLTGEVPNTEPKAEPMVVEQAVLLFLKKRSEGAKKTAIVTRLVRFPQKDVESAINRLRKRGEIVSSGPGRNSVWAIAK